MSPILFVILTAFCFVANVQSATPSLSTLGDKLVSIRRNELMALLGRNVGGRNDFMPLESKQYKCQVLSALYQSARMKYPDLPNEILSPRMINMLDNCATRDFRLTDFFSQPFIFPGTKYCGQGNISENYHDLGIFNETDACCREHDYCDDIIRPGRTKHNLINPFGTTRLHCKCDQALRECFRKVNSVVSNTVGYIFFSLLQTQCFDLEHPATGCLLWRRGAVRLYCVKYELQEDQPKRWQWFDQEPYI